MKVINKTNKEAIKTKLDYAALGRERYLHNNRYLDNELMELWEQRFEYQDLNPDHFFFIDENEKEIYMYRNLIKLFNLLKKSNAKK